ncbi:MAG: phage tail assembly chaperone [Rhodospirillales bacterium]|nr:phage tail assembly chaperone [Rhodospirillales bacterium]
MAVGLGVLRLDPKSFWSLTLLELSAAATVVLGPRPAADSHPQRADLASLMARYPDQPKEQ